jgi:cytochrome P450
MNATQADEWKAFTPHDPEFVADPMPAYRWLRDNAPVFHVRAEDIWLLSRYDDILAAARDWNTFSQRESVGYSRVRDPRPVLTAADPPLHTELRRLTAPLFTPRAVADHRATAAALLDGLLDQAFATDSAVNFSEAVANPYLSRLVGGLMGIPEPDLPEVKDGATAASLAMSGDFSDGVMERVRAFQDYFEAFVQDRTDQHRQGEQVDGLITRKLMEPTPSGRELTTAERVSYETLLATGGNETTAQLLSNLLLTLAEQPAILDGLRSTPGLRPSAVEESLRYISPVTGLFRHTTREVVLHGVPIQPDAKVLLLYGSGNHDERHYEVPEEFRLDRFPRGFADADHLSFTTGIHVCLGAHLARLLIDVFLDRMATRVGAIEIAGPVRRSHNALVRVMDELPVRLVAT